MHQDEWPERIELLRYAPDRGTFSLKDFDPRCVESANDLPPYLIVGPLRHSTFERTSEGWSAAYIGDDEGTELNIRYYAGPGLYSIDQEWRGVSGGMAGASDRLSLDQVIGRYLFPAPATDWDHAAKQFFADTHGIPYLPHRPNAPVIRGIPDGSFHTILAPIPVKAIQHAREHLARYAEQNQPPFPIRADVVLATQEISIPERECEDWLQNPELFERESQDSGMSITHGLHRASGDRTTSWQATRIGYLLTVTAPFVSLTTLVDLLASSTGPLNTHSGPGQRNMMRPWIAPAEDAVASAQHMHGLQGPHTHCSWIIAAHDLLNRLPQQPVTLTTQQITQAEDAFTKAWLPNPMQGAIDAYEKAILTLQDEALRKRSESATPTSATPSSKPHPDQSDASQDPEVQLAKLLQVPTHEQRIDLIADDIQQMPPQQRFSSIDPMKLAEAIFDDYPNFWGEPQQAGHSEEDIENGLGWLEVRRGISTSTDDCDLEWEADQGCAGALSNIKGPYEIYVQTHGNPYRDDAPTDDIQLAAENVASEACFRMAQSEGQVELFAEFLGACHMKPQKYQPRGEPEHDMDLVEIRWRRWTHSGDFDPNIMMDVEAEITHARIERDLLLNSAYLHDGLGVEKAFSWAEYTNKDFKSVPDEVLDALEENLRDRWKEDLIEEAEDDQDFLASWPSQLRLAADAIIRHSRRT